MSAARHHNPDLRARDLVVRMAARAEALEAEALVYLRRAHGRNASILKQSAVRATAEAEDYRLAVALLEARPA